MMSNKKRIILSIILAACLTVAFTPSALSQAFLPKKDLVFTQVFAGPSGGTTYSASITVTNRGTLTYNGTMHLFTGADGDRWNPSVNQEAVTNGSVDVVLGPDETKSFLITDSVFTVGYVFFYTDSISLDNHIEGNLTYFAANGSTLMDAVGVPESREFLITTLPFDWYADVGLALANPLPAGGPANVSVILFDEDSTAVANCLFTLDPGEHYSAYLWQLPWYSDPPQDFGPIGKVEISSDIPISGIAMLVTPGSAAGAQISTLPLGGTPLNYTFVMTGTGSSSGQVFKGEMTLWIEGSSVDGYLIFTEIDMGDGSGNQVVADPYGKPVPILVNGQLIGTELDLAFYTGPVLDAWPGVENYGAVAYLYVMDYTPSANIIGDDIPDEFATWNAFHVWDNDQAIEGGNLVINNTIIAD